MEPNEIGVLAIPYALRRESESSRSHFVGLRDRADGMFPAMNCRELSRNDF